MDIDKFLDRELSDIDISNQDFGESLQTEQHQSMSLGQASLKTDRLSQIEYSYTQLWSSVLQKRMSWNREIYEQIFSLNNELFSALSKEYDNAKARINEINGLLARGKSYISSGNREESMKVYLDIQQKISMVHDLFFEEKKGVNEKIMDFYKDLKILADNELIRKTYGIVQEVNQLLDSANSSLSRKDFRSAIESYNKCCDAFMQLPSGFAKYKNNLGTRLLEIYKNISIHAEIASLQKLLASQFKEDYSKNMIQ